MQNAVEHREYGPISFDLSGNLTGRGALQVAVPVRWLRKNVPDGGSIILCEEVKTGRLLIVPKGNPQSESPSAPAGEVSVTPERATRKLHKEVKKGKKR